MKARLKKDGLRLTEDNPPYAKIDMPNIDAEGKGLIFGACDLQARMVLIDMSEALYNAGEKSASCTLIHAGEYLKDRLCYQLYPWPKGCIPHNFGIEETQ